MCAPAAENLPNTWLFGAKLIKLKFMAPATFVAGVFYCQLFI